MSETYDIDGKPLFDPYRIESAGPAWDPHREYPEPDADRVTTRKIRRTRSRIACLPPFALPQSRDAACPSPSARN